MSRGAPSPRRAEKLSENHVTASPAHPLTRSPGHLVIVSRASEGGCMHVRRILETCLYVDDLDAAERFYTDVLGLERFARAEGRHVFFRSGESVFLLFNPAATLQPSGEVPTHGA